MSTVAMLMGRGTAGLPPAAPVDFGSLVLPPSPNAHLAAPAGFTAERHETTAVLPVSPEAGWAALRMLGEGVERCWRLAEWPDRRQAQWVVRSRFANFPDIVAGQIVPLPGGCGLFLYSRSLVGWSDFGVNRRRIGEWRQALDEALRAP